MKSHYTSVHREPLTSDIVFKAVFGSDTAESKAALIELLNLVLQRYDDPIVDLTYNNPFSYTTSMTEKEIIMDIKVETSKGELIDIEMQLENLNVYINRSVYYGCKQLAKSLAKGQYYDKIKPSIVISFIDGILFPEIKSFYSQFTLRENEAHDQLSNILQFHYIEMGKINWSHHNPNELNSLEKLCAYFKCSGDEKEQDFVEALVTKGGKLISMADNILKKVSEEEILQNLRESREMYRLENAWARQAAIEEGLAEGRAEGRAEGKLEVARNLKSMGMSTDKISEATGLSEEEINQL